MKIYTIDNKQVIVYENKLFVELDLSTAELSGKTRQLAPKKKTCKKCGEQGHRSDNCKFTDEKKEEDPDMQVAMTAEELKEAVQQLAVGGLTCAEIAERLGKSVYLVKKYMP